MLNKTRPSILCVTHQMSHKKRNWDSMGRSCLVLGGSGSVWGSTGSLSGGFGQYLVVLGQCRAVLVILGRYGAVLADAWWY